VDRGLLLLEQRRISTGWQAKNLTRRQLAALS
jgi:hypothetical protein